MRQQAAAYGYAALERSAAAARSIDMGLLVFACGALSVTCFTAPGRDATPLGLDWVGAAKGLGRGLSLLAIALLFLRVNFHPRMKAALAAFYPFAIFTAWAITSGLWSAAPSVSVVHAVEAAMMVALAICAATVVDDSDALGTLCFAHFLFCASIALSVLLLDSREILAGGRPYRYLHPNSLGALAGTGLVILCCGRLLWQWKWTRTWMVPGIAIALVSLYVSRSRTGLGATVFAMALLLWRTRKRALLVSVLLMAGVAAALAPWAAAIENAPQTASDYFMRGQTREDVMAGSGRDEMWRVAVKNWQEAPWFGHGYYMMSATGKVYVWYKMQYQTAHNLVLHVLTGTGIMGLIFFVWAMIAIVVPLVRAHSDSAFLALLIVAWQMIAGIFEISILGPVDPTTVAFFVVSGPAIGLVARSSVTPRRIPCA